MPLTGLDHVGVSVASLERSIPLYTFLLGTEPVTRRVWHADSDEFVGQIVGYCGLELEGATWLLPGGVVFELLQYRDPAQARVDMETYNVGNTHLGLATDDIWAEFERLREHFVFRNPEPVRIPVGPAQGGWAVYMRDPDGITIELVQPPPAAPAAP